jgi:AcrR family transcriptional regulator
MARRSEHSQEQIREMVLNAAEAIVIEKGLNALTVRKVAVEIGYTVGSIYMVFANMQDLIMHIKLRTLDQLTEQLTLDTSESAEQQIQALANHYLAFAQQHFNRWQIMFESNLDNKIELPETYQTKIEQLFSPLESLFQQLNPQASAEQVNLIARALWSGVHGICVLYLNGSLGRIGVENAESAVKLLVDTVIRGWRQAA